jgi:hypothetical protein
MRHTIAIRDQYRIDVDSTKNRMYYTMTGFWYDPADFPEYFADCDKAVAAVRPGFTLLADVRDFKTPVSAVKPLLDERQRRLTQAGLRKAAEVFSQDVIAQMALDNVAHHSGMSKRNFTDLAAAEAWLDED